MNPISDNWPVYFKEMLITKNQKHHVAIITFWTKKEYIQNKLENAQYNTIGQLYSREEGMSALTRNLLANKHITDLVIHGADLNNCKEAITNFFEKGVDENNNILGDIKAKLDTKIPLLAINELRKNVTLHDLTKHKNTEIKEYIEKIPSKKPYGNYQIFPKAEIQTPQTYPSAQSGFTIQKQYIKDAWIEILQTINKFGSIKKTQYGDEQKEVIALMATITQEDPDNPKLIDDFNFSKEDLAKYLPQVVSIENIEGIDYTYGQRLMNHQGVDQIQNIINQLNKENYTRRAIAFTWNVNLDYNNPKCPCLNLVQALVQENKLHLTCYFRSNDMYEAWPRNAFALRKLQKNICEKTNLKIGNLTTISNSAHYYKRVFNEIPKIIKNNPSLSWDTDPNGSIIIKIKEQKIVVTHLSMQGTILDEFESQTAIEAYQKIANQLKISKISHALDIGCELQKAEIAIKLDIEYTQDKPLQTQNKILIQKEYQFQFKKIQ